MYVDSLSDLVWWSSVELLIWCLLRLVRKEALITVSFLSLQAFSLILSLITFYFGCGSLIEWKYTHNDTLLLIAAFFGHNYGIVLAHRTFSLSNVTVSGHASQILAAALVALIDINLNAYHDKGCVFIRAEILAVWLVYFSLWYMTIALIHTKYPHKFKPGSISRYKTRIVGR